MKLCPRRHLPSSRRRSASAWRAFAAAALVAALVGACGARDSADLDRAEEAFRRAAADPAVASDAADELRDARKALDRARDELDDDASEEVVEHHAYVAEQKVEIARAVAEHKQALRTVDELRTKRGDVVIDTRTRAAAAARVQAYRRESELPDARRTDQGLVLTLGDALFEPGRADIRPAALHNLVKLATFLQDNPDRAVVVEGHTDDPGDDTANQELSRGRAEAVRDFLVSNGLQPDRITARGYGEGFPIAPNASADGRRQNRRVEVVILDAGAEPMAETVLSRPPLGMQGR